MNMLGLRDIVVVAPASEPVYSDHHHHAVSAPSTTALGIGVGVGVFPLLATAPCVDNSNGSRAHVTNVGGDDAENLGQTDINSEITIACRDCGNKAKKDCKYRRCRTCCKSRGYSCTTHVKSTWVPAARRRERQMVAARAVAEVAGASSGSSSGEGKRPRIVGSHNTTNSHNSTTRSFDTSSSQQDAGFKETLPGQVRAPAVFRCVRVSPIDDGDEELAYQAMVRIGGHVFKGFLYDQGVDESDRYPCISELHLESSSCDRHRESSSSPVLDQSDTYAATTGGLLGGTAYNGPIN